MDVSKVTEQDGLDMANTINFMKAGRWDLSGKDAEALVGAKKWLTGVALKMAQQLSPQTSPSVAPESQSMKIKAMGPIPSSPSKRKSRK